MSHPDEEEGEAEPSTVKYKPEKLVSYPGFNDNIPRGVSDVSKMHKKGGTGGRMFFWYRPVHHYWYMWPEDYQRSGASGIEFMMNYYRE